MRIFTEKARGRNARAAVDSRRRLRHGHPRAGSRLRALVCRRNRLRHGRAGLQKIALRSLSRRTRGLLSRPALAQGERRKIRHETEQDIRRRQQRGRRDDRSAHALRPRQGRSEYSVPDAALPDARRPPDRDFKKQRRARLEHEVEHSRVGALFGRRLRHGQSLKIRRARARDGLFRSAADAHLYRQYRPVSCGDAELCRFAPGGGCSR